MWGGDCGTPAAGTSSTALAPSLFPALQQQPLHILPTNSRLIRGPVPIPGRCERPINGRPPTSLVPNLHLNSSDSPSQALVLNTASPALRISYSWSCAVHGVVLLLLVALPTEERATPVVLNGTCPSGLKYSRNTSCTCNTGPGSIRASGPNPSCRLFCQPGAPCLTFSLLMYQFRVLFARFTHHNYLILNPATSISTPSSPPPIVDFIAHLGPSPMLGFSCCHDH